MTKDYGNVRVRPATLADADALAPKLRKEDVREIEACTDQTPLESLREGIARSSVCFAAETKDGDLIALFGVVPSSSPRAGFVWLLGSDLMHTIKLTFLRHSKAWLDVLFTNYDLLGNIVDERNELHIQWLRWLGFRFLRKMPCGRKGEWFFEFAKIK